MNPQSEQDQNNDQQIVSQEVVPKRRLGRGLNALLGGGGPANEPHSESSGGPQENASSGGLLEIALDNIQRNSNQPRQHFEKESLAELAESVRIHGVLQPVLIRELGDKYELIAGERRWLAAKQAGLTQIPCRVVDVVDQIACEYSFEENLKRKDLGVLEKAQAFRNYLDLFQSSPEELGKQLSMSRSAVVNTLRLLDLPVPIKNALQEEKLTAGHARALLSLKNVSLQLELATRIHKEQLSVRKTEVAAKELLGQSKTLPMKPTKKPDQPALSNHLKSLQDQFRDAVGVKVELKLKSKDSGQVVLHFSNQDDFERITQALRSANSKAA
ncbi:MAG: ParB/RepB/Spo0J family partition protein [Planctomycetaceae bacterium]|nr:ParB/RepB/Spo0J family partition protein [Planctomycetaceae bacterium]